MDDMRKSNLRALSLVAFNLPHAAPLVVFSAHSRRLSRCSVRRHSEAAEGGTPRDKSYEKTLESLTLEEIEALPALDELAAAAGATGTGISTSTGTGPLYCGDFSDRSVDAARVSIAFGLEVRVRVRVRVRASGLGFRFGLGLG